MASNTAFPLGVFVGGPNGSDAGVLSTVTNQFNSFTKAMGTPAEFMNAYVDQAKSPGEWPSNASWTAWSWTKMPGTADVTPMIGLPMANSWDAGNPGNAFRSFANGTYDDALRGVVKSWADHGFKEQVWRPGYEMNVQSMPWFVGSDKGTQQDYVRAFQHIADVLRSAGSSMGVDIKIVWSPNIQNWNGDINVMSMYPGNNAVDIIGPDQYDNMYPRDLYDWSKNNGSFAGSFQEWASNPVNVQHYFDYPSGSYWHPTGDGQGNGQSLQDFIDLAKATGKPIALSETGAGGGGETDTWDNAAFVKWLATKLENSGVPVSYVSVWDVNDNGPWDFSSASAGKPQTYAAWREYFGAGSGDHSPAAAAPVQTPAAAPAPAPVAAQPDAAAAAGSVVVSLSQDAWQGDAQVAISVNGQQVGGTQTITASHAAGQTQAVSLSGNFGNGQQDVSVNFLNDAFGGSSATDRNVYVDSISANGNTISPGAGLFSNGAKSFAVPASGSANASVGSNTLKVSLAEDAWQGDAQAEISLDGNVLGTVTVKAAANAASPDVFTFTGNFGSGAHSLGVRFTNDAYAGGGADRNLYVRGASFDGSDVGANGPLFSNGQLTFAIASHG